MGILKGKRCQCVVCDEIFSTERNFDRHRSGDHNNARFCKSPSEVGMVAKYVKGIPVWGMPMKDTSVFGGKNV